MTDYLSFTDNGWTKFYNDLLKEKGSDAQKNFLHSLFSKESFSKEMGKIECAGEMPPPIYNNDIFTEKHFENPPHSTESELFDTWRDLKIPLTTRASFWAYMVFMHVESGAIKPLYLARDGQKPGEQKIHRALAFSGPNSEKMIDDCVRTVIRQMGGIRTSRGNKSLFVDCPFARAWWCERLLQRIIEFCPYSKGRIRQCLRQSKAHWEHYVAATVSRTPVFGLESVQNAMVISLAKLVDPTTSRAPSAGQIREIYRRFCIQAGSCELGALEFDEICTLIDSVISSVGVKVYPIDQL